jgi:YjbE family integral membrane protein
VFAELLSPEALAALVSVILIDIALAGDNAIVVGMAAAGLPAKQRRQAILVGIAAAAGLRIVFAAFTVQLLQIIGLLLAGGILLLWVAWKLWREIRAGTHREQGENEVARGEAALDGIESDPSTEPITAQGKTFGQAVTQIVIADVSMSLDNVLAVAGAAREHEIVLIFGLALSVALMGLAASLIANLLRRYHWIAYLGLIIILYVALRMIWEGAHEVFAVVQP